MVLRPLALLVALCLVALFSAGCDSSNSPTEITNTVMLEGTLQDGGVSLHKVTIQEIGTVRIVLADVAVRPDDPDAPPIDETTLALAVKIGRDEPEGCRFTATFTMVEGLDVLLSLSERPYCFEVSDIQTSASSVPEAVSVDYTVVIEER